MVFVISFPSLSNHKTCYSIKIEKVLHFLVLSPKQVNYPSNFFASSFYDKTIIIVRSIVKKSRNLFRHTIL